MNFTPYWKTNDGGIVAAGQVGAGAGFRDGFILTLNSSGEFNGGHSWVVNADDADTEANADDADTEANADDADTEANADDADTEANANNADTEANADDADTLTVISP